jgi:hypothetical protein
VPWERLRLLRNRRPDDQNIPVAQKANGMGEKNKDLCKNNSASLDAMVVRTQL